MPGGGSTLRAKGGTCGRSVTQLRSSGTKFLSLAVPTAGSLQPSERLSAATHGSRATPPWQHHHQAEVIAGELDPGFPSVFLTIRNELNSATMLSDIPSETPPENLAALAEDHYFAANPPPKDLEKHVAQARDFINYHSAAGKRLVLVTSGGTTVPLGVFPGFPDLILDSPSGKPTTDLVGRKADGALH